MAYLIFSDLHLHTNYPWNKIDADVVINTICDYANKDDTCIFAGDWYEAKDNVPHELVSFTGDKIAKLSKAFKTVYFIPGNHDAKNMEHTGLDFAGFCVPNVVVVRDPVEIDNLVLVPFTPDKWKFSEWMAQIQDKDKKTLITHTEFKNMRLIDGNVSVVSTGHEPIAVSAFKAVLDGHYHIRQTVGNITTIGVPRHMSFKDCGTDPCFKVIDKGTAYSVPVTGVTKFIKLQHSPTLFNEINSLDPTYKYKIKVMSNNSPTRKVLEELQAMRASSVVEIRGIEYSHKVARTVTTVELSKILDVEDLFESYLNTYSELPLPRDAYMFVAKQWLKGETVL